MYQSAQEVEAVLAEVYARAEFAGLLEEPSPQTPAWRERLAEWLNDTFGHLFEISPGAGATSVLAWALIIGLALTLGWVAYRTVRGRLAARVPAEPGHAAASPPERDLSYWLALARERTSAGHHRAATAALYQALIRALDGAGELRYDPSKTPGDYRGETSSTARARLDRFLVHYEPVVFGGAGADRALLRDLETLIPQTGA